MAARRGHVEVLSELLKASVDVDPGSGPGWTALMEASDAGQVECVSMLLCRGAQIDYESYEGWTALMRAAARGRYDVASILISSGAALDYESHDGWTALMRAADGGQRRIVRRTHRYRLVQMVLAWAIEVRMDVQRQRLHLQVVIRRLSSCCFYAGNR